MARTGITQQQVIDAAEQLHAEDKPITVQSLREAVGAGSFSTISTHLRRWQEQRHAAAAPAAPPQLDAVARRAVQCIWDAAAQISRTEIEAARRSARAELTTLQEHHQGALQEIERLERQAEQAREDNGAQELEIRGLRAELSQAQAALAAGAARMEELTTRQEETRQELYKTRSALEQKIEECGRLHGELAAVKTQPKPHSSKPNGRDPATTPS